MLRSTPSVRARAAAYLSASILAGLSCDPSRPVRHFVDGSIAPCPRPPLLAGSESLLGDNDCFLAPCAAIASQAGCTITISLSGCTDDRLTGTIDASGSVTFAPAPTLGTCRRADAPPPDAKLALACASPAGACGIDLYERPPPLAATTSTLAIYPDLPFVAPLGSTVQPLDENDPFRGYLAGMALLPGVLVVATFDGSFTLGCGGRSGGALFLVDPERLEVVRTLKINDCIAALAPDPTAPGFVAIDGSAPPFSISRYDREGRRLQTMPLPPLDGARQNVRMFAADDRGRLAIVLDGGNAPSAYLVLVDATTLNVTATSSAVPGKVRAGAFGDGRTLAVTLGQGIVQGFDADRAGAVPGFNLRASRRVSVAAGYIAFDRASNTHRFIISATGKNAALWVGKPSLGTDPELETALFFEQPAVPWAIAADPQSSPSMATVLVGLTTLAPDFEARVARFDPAAHRFLPGSARIGRGPVSEMIVDAKGRVFAMLPWSASIARITFP